MISSLDKFESEEHVRCPGGHGSEGQREAWEGADP